MTDSHGNTDLAAREPTASNPHLPRVELPSELELAIEEVDYIDEHDIRTLVPYNWDSDGETLVGIGPATRIPGRKSAPRAAPAPKAVAEPKTSAEPPSSLQPVAIATRLRGDDDVPPAFRAKPLGIWGVAIPALVAAATVIVVLLRAMIDPTPAQSATNAAVVVAPSTAGLAVRLTGADVRVILDGQDRGRPPMLITGLTPGSHALAITGPGFAPYEQPLTLPAEHVSTIEPELTLLQGAIRVFAGTSARGVNVEVVGANERRVLESLPARLPAAPGDYLVRARKPGFFPFDANVRVTATSPEPELTINLEQITPLNASRGPRAAWDSADSSAIPISSAPDTGTLSITSSPPSSVVLDGRPLGKAPRSLAVAVGSHTVVFVHPKFGRRSVTVNVPADQTTSASVDF
jgi:hypothetical protein